MDDIYEKIGFLDIFDTDEQADAVIWYLLFLLGGKVVIPINEEFWADSVPDDEDRRIVLRKEDGKLVLVAESKQWQ